MSGLTTDVFYTRDYTMVTNNAEITPANYQLGKYVMFLGDFEASAGNMLQLEIYFNGNNRMQSTAVTDGTTPSKLVVMLEVYDGTAGRNIYGYCIQHGTMANDKICVEQINLLRYRIWMYFTKNSYPFVHATTTGNWIPNYFVVHVEALSLASDNNNPDLFHFGDSSLPGSTNNEVMFKIPILYKMKGGIIETTNGFNVSSSRRYKTNIDNLPENYNLNMVLKMRPIVYNKEGEPGNQTLYPGLIAEDLHDLGGNLFILYQNGIPEALDYSRLTVLLISAIQELNERLDRLTSYFEKVKKEQLLRNK